MMTEQQLGPQGPQGPAGGGLWTQHGSDNVGIGTSSAAYSLNVSGDQNGRL